MKRNLRRICILLLAMIAIGKSIFAASTTAGENGSIFSGYMKFIFAGAALVLLVLILYLSYKLDKEEPLMADDGKVSKKKLGSANRKNKKSNDTSKNDGFENHDEDFFSNDDLYEENIEPGDFASEEAAGFKDDLSEGKVVQKLDDFSDFNDFEDSEESDELNNVDSNSNNIPDALEDNFNNIPVYDEEDDGTVEDLNNYSDEDDEVDDYDDTTVDNNTVLDDEDDEFNDLNNDITKAINELESGEYETDEVEDNSSLLNAIDNLDDDEITNENDAIEEDDDDFEEYEEVEDDNSDLGLLEDNETEETEDDFDFDTSALDDIEDYEDPKAKKTLSNTNMTPKSNPFVETSNDGSIGFRNKTEEDTESIGFRKKPETKETVGFKRKITPAPVEEVEDNTSSLMNDLDELDDFDSNDFLKNIDDTMKASTSTTKTVSKKKKIDSDENAIKTTGTTTKKKKI